MTKAALSSHATPQGKVVTFSGTLDAAGAAALWPEMTRVVAEKPNAIDLSAVDVMDSAGAILVLRAGDAVAVQGGSPDVLAVLERNRAALKAAPIPTEPPRDFAPITAVGGAVFGGVQAALSGIAFAGEALVAAFRVLCRPRMFRGAEFLRHLDEIGLRAFPLTLLLGFLIGLIHPPSRLSVLAPRFSYLILSAFRCCVNWDRCWPASCWPGAPVRPLLPNSAP